MFFRESFSKKSPTPILQLVENKRDRGKVCQQLVISLGRMQIKKSIRRAVSDRVESILKGQDSLFKLSEEIEQVAQLIAQRIRAEGKWINARRVTKVETPDNSVEQVFIDEIDHTNSCELGPELVALSFWNKLKLSDILRENRFSDIEIKTALVSIISRLIYPKSENNLPVWVRNTSLPDLMGFIPEDISKIRYYRISDKLLKNQEAIEQSLAIHEKNIFNLKRNIYLYDLTNTYFEGEQKENSKAKYSCKSKEKRNDCPQVCVGLVVDEDGFAIKHKLFEGNKSDSDTLLTVIESLKKDVPNNEPTVIVDSGMSKDEHLAAIRKAGFHYVVTMKRCTRVNYPEIFGDENLFKIISDRENKSEVKIYKKEYKDHVLLFCKSDGRKNKETAIKDKAHEKIKQDMEKLSSRIQKGKLKKAEKINQAIGRLKERHHRVSRFYDICYNQETCRLEWEHKNDLSEDMFDGCYIMKTSRKNLGDKEIWHLYMTLLKVERAFKHLKSNLGLRPNNHYKENRVDAHIFITILAYHLLHSIEYTLSQHKDFRIWPTIKQLLETHCYTTLIIPTVKGPVINIRKSGKPDSVQKEIYSKLNVIYTGLPIKKIYA